MKVLFSVDPYISSGKYGYNQVLISSVWIPCDVDSDLQKSTFKQGNYHNLSVSYLSKPHWFLHGPITKHLILYYAYK